MEEAREELLLSAGASDHCSLIFISQSIYSFDLTLNSKEGGFSEEEVFAAGDMDVFLRHTFYFLSTCKCIGIFNNQAKKFLLFCILGNI